MSKLVNLAVRLECLTKFKYAVKLGCLVKLACMAKTYVWNYTTLRLTASVQSPRNYLTIGPIGSRNDAAITYVKSSHLMEVQ